jgi:hypothetical protein
MLDSSGSIIVERQDSTDSNFIKTPFVELSINGTTLVLNDTIPGTGVAAQSSGAAYANVTGMYLLDFSETIEMGTGEGSVGSFNMIDTRWDVLEDWMTKIAWGAENDQLMYRYGWRDASRINTKYYPWHAGLVSEWQVEYVPMLGTKIHMNIVDLGAKLRIQGCKNDSYPATATIDVVLRAVFTAYGDKNLTYLVSPTTALVGQNNTMMGNTPMAYVNMLIKLAGFVISPYIDSQSGTPIVYVGPDVMMNPCQASKTGIIPTYTWGRKSDSPALSFNVQMDAQQLIKQGVRSTATTYVDKTTKLPIHLLFTQDTRERDPGSSLVAPTPSVPDRYAIGSPQNDVFTSTNMAKRSSDLYSKQVYTANLTIIGDPTLYPLMYVGVVVLKDSQFAGGARQINPGDIHRISGLFQIMSVQHTITPGSYTTSLELRRMGSAFGDVKTGKIVYLGLGDAEVGRSQVQVLSIADQ